MAREFARKFYSSKRWQECRDAYATNHRHLCEDCLARGIYKPGIIVHHIEELTPLNIDNPEVTLNHNNLRLVCRECHAEEHRPRNKGRRYVIDSEGNVLIKSK